MRAHSNILTVVSYVVSTLDGLGAYLPIKLQGSYCIFMATCMKKKIPALKICTLMLCVLRYPFGQHLDASRKGFCDGMMVKDEVWMNRNNMIMQLHPTRPCCIVSSPVTEIFPKYSEPLCTYIVMI